MARNPTTNSGTIGARSPPSSTAARWRRRQSPTPATIGASRIDPGQLDEQRRGQRRLGVGRRRRRDLADVVDAGAGPGPEPRGGEVEGVADRREHGDREAAAQRDEADGVGDLLLVGVGQRLHRRHRRGAADRVPGGDQQPEPGTHAHQPSQQLDPEERRHDDGDDGEGADDAEVPDLVDDSRSPSTTTPARSRRLAGERDPRTAGRADQPGVGDDDAEHDAADERRDVDDLAEQRTRRRPPPSTTRQAGQVTPSQRRQHHGRSCSEAAGRPARRPSTPSSDAPRDVRRRPIRRCGRWLSPQ